MIRFIDNVLMESNDKDGANHLKENSMKHLYFR